MDRSNIDKIAHSGEDRLLLAKLWDKINAGIRKNIPANTCFLSPQELEMARCLFGQPEGLYAFGGYPEAERKMLVFLPDYLEESALMEEDSPGVCLRCTFYLEDSLSHRDFLGALMGAGIGRETVGDICVDKGSCDFFVTAEIAPYILQNFTSAGRTRVHIRQIPLIEASIPAPEVKEIEVEHAANLPEVYLKCGILSAAPASVSEEVLPVSIFKPAKPPLTASPVKSRTSPLPRV